MIFSFLTILSLNLWAQTSKGCNFEVKCENFSLRFKSPSGDCVEDDTKVTLHTLSGSAPVDLPIKEAWFIETSNIGNINSTCSSTSYSQFPAYDLGAYKLFFLRYDGRPGFNIIQALVLDSKTAKVVDQIELGRYMRNTLGILKTARGYKLRVIKGVLKEMNCDCDAGVEEAWMEVSFKNKKLHKRWL